MNAEIISIGDELTSGQRLDTNSQWLSQRLGEIGVRVLYHTTVADDLPANLAVFQSAVERADVVIATGGLGPTADDLTREVLAALAGVELVRSDEALAHIRALFARRNRPMPERNVAQAMFPAGSRAIDNPHGTAPGIAMEVPRGPRPACRIFALPGVPVEMQEMWYQTVSGAILAGGTAGRVIRHRVIKCFGVGESDLEQMLPDLIRRGREPSVGITVSQATISLRIAAAGATAEECHRQMEPTVRTIYDCLGKLIFGEGDDELQDAVVRLLRQYALSLATAEWGTAGLLTQWLDGVAGADDYYFGGLVVAEQQALVKAVGVPPEVLTAHALASKEVARAMAIGCRERFSTDMGLAVGPLPHVAGNAASDKPPEFALALADRHGVLAVTGRMAGHPAIVVPHAAKQALNLVRLRLIGAPSS